MKARAFQLVHVPAFLLVGVMLLLASCTKEDPIAPVGADTLAVEKSLGEVGTETPKPANSSAKGGNEGDGSGSGISDDGDDISGTERKRTPGN